MSAMGAAAIGGRLLLLSTSTASGFPFLALWASTIMTFLGPDSGKNVIFVPFARIQVQQDEWDYYTNRVQRALPELNITGIHAVPDMIAAVNSADAIMIGGGNTFNLLYHLQKNNLIEAIRNRVIHDNIPYIGSSAGANAASPNISTTNDMPIIMPESLNSLNIFPYNLNVHYSNWKPPGYGGEGRNDRLFEAAIAMKATIIAISESIALMKETNGSIFVIKSDANKRSPHAYVQVRIIRPMEERQIRSSGGTMKSYWPSCGEVPLNRTGNVVRLDPFLDEGSSYRYENMLLPCA